MKTPRVNAGAGLSCLAAAISLLGFNVAEAAKFNPMFLKDKDAGVDLRYFEKNNGFVPGTYSVDIYLNQKINRRQEIIFTADEESVSAAARPVLTLGMLREMGVSVSKLKAQQIVSPDAADDEAVEILRIDGAAIDFDVTALALFLDIPHAYMSRRSRGYVDPSLWDSGINAAFTSYQANVSRNSTDDYDRDYAYLGLRNGLNVGQWRFRNESSISQGDGVERAFSSNRTFIERDVTSFKSQLAFGQLYTSGDIFDSNRLLGAQLRSDSGMLSSTENGFAPVIHGIAESHARVEVRQNGYVIYSTSVSPGAFEIRDIYPSGSNGDLEVTIVESDGRERKYTQAYSYLPIMTRRGNFEYSLSVGQYDTDDAYSQPKLAQGTAVYGATDNLTAFGGLLVAENYSAMNTGIGVNSALGGTSIDVTNSRSKIDGNRSTSGQNLRFLYSKTLNGSNTNFTMAGYRYSTSGYRTLSENIEEAGLVDTTERSRGRPKNRLDLSINQTLGSIGSAYFSAGETNYWNRPGNSQRFQVGFSSSYRDISYSISASHTRDEGNFSGGADNQVSLSVSIPFGDRKRGHRLYSNMSTGGSGGNSFQSGVSGYLDEASTMSYSAQASQYSDERSAGVGLGWDAPSARLAANYDRSSTSEHYDMTASGSVVAHGGGITFGQPVGETFALVEVPVVKGASIEGSTARTDKSGHTIESYVQPYRYNWLNLDTQTLGSDVEVTETSQHVVPRRGSIVKAVFDASSGRRIQFELLMANDTKFPFGAQVFDGDGKLLAVIDNQSRALTFGPPEDGTLRIQWGSESCSAPYVLPKQDSSVTYQTVKVKCAS
ncbi:fimbrial biogenesis outer membrane usher protein [Pseudomonas denitrificans (nom. rej.)]|nr:fimbrial biogenesis outer membrane usher protein [Pseudomonas denitrificans (nom. rej.)]